LDHGRTEEQEDVDGEADIGGFRAGGPETFVVEFDQVAFDIREKVAPAKPAEEAEGETWRRRLHGNNFLNVVLIIKIL
jgi:hypothetical protein